MDGTEFQLAVEWFVSCVYDKVEAGFGRVAAFTVSLLLGIMVLGLMVALAWYVLWR